jgi:hypothetical protein
MTQLPEDNNIDIASLASIFGHRSTSYKFLFFQALLSLAKENLFKKYSFSFNELEIKMLDIADYPINVFKLNFGTQDRIAKKFKDKSINLIKYVPYRLLTPFFENELKGMLESKKNKEIERLSNIDMEYNPIYKINNTGIEIYPEWMQYFISHFIIVEGWAFWHWVNYLQNKNPNAISLVNKLQKPSVRLSLNQQTKYWKTVLKHQELSCVFSSKPITRNDLSLDHFLPWSFIGHDQLWNLIPISKSVNSSKSDNIPSMDKYLDRFIEIQALGLETTHKIMTIKKWQNQADDFVMGLNISFSNLVNNDNMLTKKYKETILPLSDIAHNAGFNSDWIYKG